MAPGADPTVPPAYTPLGVMEITISGMGTGEIQSSALPVLPGSPLTSGANITLTPVNESDTKFGCTGIAPA